MSRSNLLPIETSVRDSLQRYFSQERSPEFVLAVSGGMDSMSLMYLFKELGISAIVSHINYQKRGEASEKDAQLVAEKAAEWGFYCDIFTADSENAEGMNFQQWARDVRYKQFRRLAAKHTADGIAVAHHEDDQVETILQKMFRGAGLASWSGMEMWDGEIFRPLLAQSRSEIAKYVDQNAIPYRTDESNLQADFARNLLRNEWLEELSNFFPGWKQNVLRIQQQAECFQQSLSWIAERLTDANRIDRDAFHTLEPRLQKAFILFLAKRKKPRVELSRNVLNRIDELGELQTGKTIQLAPEIALVRDRDYYVLDVGSDEDFESIIIDRRQVENGSYRIDEFTFSIEASEYPDFEEALYLDADKLSWPITVRRWQQGDQFRPLGMQGHQQVANHLTNRKVSAAHKNEALVIESFEETICAIIFPRIKNQTSLGTISEQIKCDDHTRWCLKVE